MLAIAEDARERVPVRVDVGGASLVESEAREVKACREGRGACVGMSLERAAVEGRGWKGPGLRT